MTLNRTQTEYIELRGAHFRNKGAQMMLLAMVEGLRRIRPDARLVMAPSGRSPYHSRAALGLYQKIWLQRGRVQWGPAISTVLPGLFKEAYGLVDDRSLTAVLDASGFAYSDQWGTAHTNELAAAAERWHRQGTKLILMPQAFGPFELASNRAAMQRAAACSTAIFVRDSTSLAHLQRVLPSRDVEKTRLAPDFTTLLAPVYDDGLSVPQRGACLIPNMRLLDKYGIRHETYVSFLASAAGLARDSGLTPFFLLHEGPEDAALISAANEILRPAAPVLQSEDGRAIKSAIGRSEVVLGSRYHGLVSALCQSVPAIAVGWSHKYRELFADYGVPDLALDLKASGIDAALTAFGTLMGESERHRVKCLLRTTAATEAERARAVWQYLDAIL